MRTAFLTLCIISLILVIAHFCYPHRYERWVVYYDSKLSAESFLPYDVIVFDRQEHPSLELLKQHHKLLLGYLSIGEAETFRDNYQWLQGQKLLLATGPEWKGNPVIDIRRPEWQAYVLDVLVPDMITQGFNGIMLDTTDSLIWLENTSPSRYPGLKSAALSLIKNIHARYPGLKIMLNRGMELLPEIGGTIDMVLAESIYPFNKAGTPSTAPSSDETYQHYLNVLGQAKKQFPHLKIYTLDYLEKNTSSDMRIIYKIQRMHGFIPYVCPPGLQTVIAEP